MRDDIALWARGVARVHLEVPLPRRWAHTCGVARRARTLAPRLGAEADLVEAAAWLHDVAYAPDLAATGFHPLDGARHLRDVHRADPHLCRLVAHHSCALVEAEERGIADVLTAEFGTTPPELSDALLYCDMTTGPGGERRTVEERIDEILGRYGPGHLVTRSITRATPTLVETVRRVEVGVAPGQVTIGAGTSAR